MLARPELCPEFRPSRGGHATKFRENLQPQGGSVQRFGTSLGLDTSCSRTLVLAQRIRSRQIVIARWEFRLSISGYEEEFAFELRTRDRERKLINKIAISIEKIKQDDYGWCESCGDEIGIKRLEARPTATHCIDCKTLDEIKERQLSG